MTRFATFNPNDKPNKWSARGMNEIATAAESFKTMDVQAPLRLVRDGNRTRLYLDNTFKIPLLPVRQYFRLIEEFPNFLKVSYAKNITRNAYVAKPPLLQARELEIQFELGGDKEYTFLNDQANRVEVIITPQDDDGNPSGESFTETWVIGPAFEKNQLIRGVNQVRGLDVRRFGDTEEGENPNATIPLLWDFDGPDLREWRLE